MAITIRMPEAERVMEQAYDLACSDTSLPDYWTSVAQQTFAMDFKTYTPALGAALLARAVDDRVDPLAIKSAHSQYAFSLRTVGHNLLIPLADRYGFSVRTTTREPLNNQPFFRYDHLLEIDRVRNRAEFDRYVNSLKPLANLHGDDAVEALAAFVRVGLQEAANRPSYDVSPVVGHLAGVIAASDSFMADGLDVPRRAQALVAAAFDSVHDDVRSRAINDPSRDIPGDVQLYDPNGKVVASVEVRTKPVQPWEIRGFVNSCLEADIDRVMIAEFLPESTPVNEGTRPNDATLMIYHLPSEMLEQLWAASAKGPAAGAAELFHERMINRLVEIEAPETSVRRWIEMIERNKRDSAE